MGQTLNRQPQEPGHALGITHKLAMTLQYAHEHGVSHRDLKPANVMVDARGELIVMDFGLARVEDEERRTVSGDVFGTPQYMAPEQVEGISRALGKSCDIYSLGVILYEMLTGQLPFSGSKWEVPILILEGRSRPPSAFRKSLAPAIDELVQKAMSRNPADRHATMAEFAREIDACLAGAGGGESGGEPLFSPRPAPPVATPVRVATPPEEVRPKEAPPEPVEPRSLRSPATEMVLTRIVPDEFWMGSVEGRDDEKPRHKVRITNTFYLGVRRITKAEYRAVTTGRDAPVPDLAPVTNVNWFEAVEFCNALSRREGLPAYYAVHGEDVSIRGGTGYRLPTEAEWEFACRADPKAVPAWPETVPPPAAPMIPPDSEKTANAFGLIGMEGSLGEWCWDRYDPQTYKAEATSPDPTGPATGPTRVVRGGFAVGFPSGSPVSSRYGIRPKDRYGNIGFRVARTRPAS